jgi:hypothetical protein
MNTKRGDEVDMGGQACPQLLSYIRKKKVCIRISPMEDLDFAAAHRLKSVT